MSLKIEHNENKHRFSAVVDGYECLLDYRVKSPGVLEYYHTFVPIELRGQKLAEQIATFAMDYARATNSKVIPTCPYVQRFVGIHPEYKDLII